MLSLLCVDKKALTPAPVCMCDKKVGVYVNNWGLLGINFKKSYVSYLFFLLSLVIFHMVKNRRTDLRLV